MEILIYIIVSTFIISLGGLIGFFTLIFKEKQLAKIILLLVSLSAGALMGGAFIHLLPEATDKIPNENIYLTVLGSFIFFFFVEKLLNWRHIHSFGYMNLIGDSVHNFIDGLIIAGTFITDIKLGIATTFAVALHEIPQEIGDFGVLLYAGFGKRKALLANFMVALTAIIGGIFGYFLSIQMNYFISYLLPFAAGGFIYIAASDLMPEIRKEASLGKSMLSFGVFLIGVFIMFLVKLIGHE
jgi:zinc and cadmium transporter